MVRNTSDLDLDLRAVIYREGRFTLAHCLELDLVAEGDSAADAVQTLVELIQMQIDAARDAGDLGSIFRPAPPEYWHLYARGKRRPSPRLKNPAHRLQSREMVLT